MNATTIASTGAVTLSRQCRERDHEGIEPAADKPHPECGFCAVHCHENGGHGHKFPRKTWNMNIEENRGRREQGLPLVRHAVHGEMVSFRVSPLVMRRLKEEAARRDCSMTDLLLDLLERGWAEVPGPLGYAQPLPTLAMAVTA